MILTTTGLAPTIETRRFGDVVILFTGGVASADDPSLACARQIYLFSAARFSVRETASRLSVTTGYVRRIEARRLDLKPSKRLETKI